MRMVILITVLFEIVYIQCTSEVISKRILLEATINNEE